MEVPIGKRKARNSGAARCRCRARPPETWFGSKSSAGTTFVGAGYPTERMMVAEAASARPGNLAPSRRELFGVAAALAATVLTGAAAVAGLSRRVPAAPSVPAVGQTITPAASTVPQRVEPGD